MARQFRNGRPTIGVLAGWQFAWTATPLSYLDPIFRGIRLAAREFGCNVLLACGMGSWSRHVDELRPAWPIISQESDFVPIGPWNTDGLIAVNPLHSQTRSHYLQTVRAAGHPLIYIASGEEGPSVLADNRSGILQAMQHLVAHGHRRIAFVAGSPDDMEGDSGERLQAYRDAIIVHSLVSDPRLVSWGLHTYNGGDAAMREILASGASFTAVLASNDESALGAMQVLNEIRLRIPEDVALVGFDDRPESIVQTPPLSSVRVPLPKMGYRAVEALVRYLTGQTGTIESVRVATRLVTRASCGCGRNIPHATAHDFPIPFTKPQRSSSDRTPQELRFRLARTMAAAIRSQAESMTFDQIETLCRQLAAAFDASITHNDPKIFQDTLETILQKVAESEEDILVWQAALSHLRRALEENPTIRSQPETLETAHTLLNQAHLWIDAQAQQEYRQRLVSQRWTLNRLGTLTAHLSSALDETQIYEVLTQHLPAMGVQTTWIALFGAEGQDQVAWSTVHDINALEKPALHIPSREFPPNNLVPKGQPFNLSLFPLTGPHDQLGFVVFDTARLDLYGVITQQLATAFNSVALYREAIEGRRLAEEANELKGRFLSTVSHELRTPLNLIMGLSGILLQQSDEIAVPLPEPYRKDVEQIHTSAQLLGGLIGDVLDLASSDAGQLRLSNEFVDLNEALRLVAETGRQLAFQKGLKWRADFPDSQLWVWGDRTRLRQVALNLINNAIKFTRQGQVCLEIVTLPDSVTVKVCDTGLGIPIEEQAVIFDEFRRSERSMARGYGGLGLGLAICRRLVEMHGGTIGVHSLGQEGAGSTFFFTLPVVQPPAIEAQSATFPSLTQESILVLTHRAGAGQRLHEHLSGRGFDVHTVFVDESPDWLTQLVVSPPGAAVIDVSTTLRQGWHILKAIKGHPKIQHLPVLFCSLTPDGGAVLEFDYLTKPIEMTELTRALDQHWLVPDVDREFKTILIVDDDLNTLEMHSRIVEAQFPSHRVLQARNGIEALDALRRENIDLVLLDLMMPQVDGFDVLEAMRSQETTRGIPVIVLTGQVLTERDMARLNRGVATVLSKGVFSVEETVAHVDAALERSRKLSGEAQRLVRQAMAFIHEHYANPISRSDIAQHVALSDDYLTFCFRKELGVTPITYLNRFRVNQARRLLTETHKSITEIALEIGFSDSGYFSRVFRREVGLSPEAYRQA
ncbi:MAG: substrate-binding domain-containing protein [Anaerolineae bacterium]|nr:substrate-binding domain-containing protein [Anaerolineae bacterium]